MADRFGLIAITPECSVPNEVASIMKIIDAGFDYVHIRKPGYAEADFRKFVASIPSRYRCFLKINDYFHLAEDLGVAGVHLNWRNPAAPDGFVGKVSKSCHSIGELSDIGPFEYVFLSPIFDSISKKGYCCGFSDSELLEARNSGLIGDKVVALGGVTADNLAEVRKLGFGGAAFLGYLFGETDSNRLEHRLSEIVTKVR